MKELLAYKMQPAGHEEPPRRRSFHGGSGIQKLFEDWLQYAQKTLTPGQFLIKNAENLYEYACQLVKDVSVSPDEIHALLYTNWHQYSHEREADMANIFCSAVYNKSEDKVITLDIDLKFPKVSRQSRESGYYTAYRLSQDKIFVNKARYIWDLGRKSDATIINYGFCSRFGLDSGGLLINSGEIAELGAGKEALHLNMSGFIPRMQYGRPDSGCIIINARKHEIVIPKWKFEKSFERNEGFTYTNGDIPKLGEYIDELSDKFAPAKALKTLEKMGANPAKQIRDKIFGIIKEAGHNV